MSDTTTPAAGQGTPAPATGTQQGTANAAPQATAPAPTTTVLTGEQNATPTGEGKPADAKPVDFDLKFPDGVEADKALAEEFKKFAQELKLDGSAAQKSFEHLLKSRGAVLTGAKEKAAEAHRQRVTEWSEALKADKEFGGAKFDQNVIVAKKALTKFGNPEFQKFLNTTGLGSHPELVKMLYRVGQAISEDSVAVTTGIESAKQQESEMDRLKRQYDNSPQMFK